MQNTGKRKGAASASKSTPAAKRARKSPPAVAETPAAANVAARVLLKKLAAWERAGKVPKRGDLRLARQEAIDSSVFVQEDGQRYGQSTWPSSYGDNAVVYKALRDAFAAAYPELWKGRSAVIFSLGPLKYDEQESSNAGPSLSPPSRVTRQDAAAFGIGPASPALIDAHNIDPNRAAATADELAAAQMVAASKEIAAATKHLQTADTFVRTAHINLSEGQRNRQKDVLTQLPGPTLAFQVARRNHVKPAVAALQQQTTELVATLAGAPPLLALAVRRRRLHHHPLFPRKTWKY